MTSTDTPTVMMDKLAEARLGTIGQHVAAGPSHR